MRGWDFALGLGLVLAATPAAAALTAAGVAADINARGASKAVTALVEGGSWERALAAIGGGSRDWILLTPDLARGTDAKASQALGMALARALPVAAAEVLAVIDTQRGPALGVQIVCGAAGVTGDVAGYAAAARAAVVAVPALGSARAQAMCLKELERVQRK